MIFDAVHDDIDITAAALRQEFAATAAEYDRTGAFPFDNINRLRETGLPALVAPREFGGRGFGLAKANSVVNTIARGEASTGLMLAQQYLFHGQLIRNADEVVLQVREVLDHAVIELQALDAGEDIGLKFLDQLFHGGAISRFLH